MQESLLSITTSELEADPDARFWALVMYLAEHTELQQTPEFRDFWLAYIYDAEVLNGGHLQYFHNQGVERVPETLAALRKISAHKHAEQLANCWCQVERNPVSRVRSLEQYASLAVERSFSDEDAAYYESKPEVISLLQRHYCSLIEHLVTVDA